MSKRKTKFDPLLVDYLVAEHDRFFMQKYAYTINAFLDDLDDKRAFRWCTRFNDWILATLPDVKHWGWHAEYDPDPDGDGFTLRRTVKRFMNGIDRTDTIHIDPPFQARDSMDYNDYVVELIIDLLICAKHTKCNLDGVMLRAACQ